MNLLSVSVLRIPIWVLVVSFSRMDHVLTTTIASNKTDFWQNVNRGEESHLNWKLEGNQFSLQSPRSQTPLMESLFEGFHFNLQSPSRKSILTGSLISQTLKPRRRPYCLTFWMQIQGGATLQVIEAGSETSYERIVWQSTENFWKWRQKIVSVCGNKRQSYSLIIKGILSDSERQGIFIRNVSTAIGPCPRKGKQVEQAIYFCGFDITCGWANYNISDNEARWLPKTGIQHREYLGHQNYTISVGRFATVRLPTDRTISSSIDLLSPQLKFPGESSCMQVFYKGGGDSGVVTFSKIKVDTWEKVEIFRVSGAQGQRWRKALATITETSAYRIVIGFTPGSDMETVAIDDITLREGKCPGFDLDKENNVRCSFDSQQPGCKFTSVPNFGEKFDVVEASSLSIGETPDASKTMTNNNEPVSLVAAHRISVPNPHQKDFAYLTSGMYFTSSRRNCLTFYYNIKTTKESTLLVYTSDDYFVDPFWERRTSDTEGWKEAMVELKVSRNYEIKFETNSDPGAKGYVALSSYQLTNSPCLQLNK